MYSNNIYDFAALFDTVERFMIINQDQAGFSWWEAWEVWEASGQLLHD